MLHKTGFVVAITLVALCFSLALAAPLQESQEAIGDSLAKDNSGRSIVVAQGGPIRPIPGGPPSRDPVRGGQPDCSGSIVGHVNKSQMFYPGVRDLGIPGVRLELTARAGGGMQTATTDNTGRFRFVLLCPGPYQVQGQLRHQTIGGRVWTTNEPPNEDIFQSMLPAYPDVPAGAEVRLNVNLLPISLNITGRVLHRRDRQGIEGVNVVVTPVGNSGQPGPTNANGEYEIRGLPCCSRRYAVAVSKQGIRFEPHLHTVTLRPDAAARIDFLGTGLVVMERLIDRTRQEARDILRRLGLEVREDVLDNTVPERNGKVARQNPEERQWHPEDILVHIGVWASTHRRVPGLLGGMSHNEAHFLLSNNGLVLDPRYEKHCPAGITHATLRDCRNKKGHVFGEQEPAQDSVVRVNSLVRVKIADWPDPRYVPDLGRLTMDQNVAVCVLSGAGFLMRVANVYQIGDCRGDGKILSQRPESGWSAPFAEVVEVKLCLDSGGDRGEWQRRNHIGQNVDPPASCRLRFE